LKICAEDYEERNNSDPNVQAGATKCHTLNARRHPRWQTGEPHEIKIDDVLKPLLRLDTFFDHGLVGFILDQTDEALRSLVETMEKFIVVPANMEGPEHHIGFYAIDVMFDEASGQVKLLELNLSPTAYPYLQTNVLNDDIHGTPHATDFAHMAMTSFHQFGLKDNRFSIDTCVEQFPAWSAIV